MNKQPILFRADWILPATQSPIRDGVVGICDGVITHVQEYRSGQEVVDLGHVALIPGLVNAHTHLEFSQLAQPLGEPGIAFTDWIRLVMAERRSERSLAAKRQAIRDGIGESISYGTAAVGEIASDRRVWCNGVADLKKQEIETTVFLERLGNDPDSFADTVNGAADFMESNVASTDFLPAISPHAPYSVSLDLLDRLMQQLGSTKTRVAMHLAETREEIELLQNQSGPFVELLKELNAWFPETIKPGTTIKHYLRLLGAAEHCLVIHGNYLEDEELEFIAERPNMSIVFCPRTHDYFAHDHYSLPKMAQLGINVGVGTDSRASNPDLSVWRELQMIAAKFPELNRQTILKLGTFCGAVALGIDSKLGELAPGRAARILQVRIPQGSGDDPYAAALFQPEVTPLVA